MIICSALAVQTDYKSIPASTGGLRILPAFEPVNLARTPALFCGWVLPAPAIGQVFEMCYRAAMFDPNHFIGGKFVSLFERNLRDEEIEFEIEKLFGLNEVLGFRSFIPIDGRDETLTEIDHPDLAFFDPHPYLAAGAPYGSATPFVLRSGAAQRLAQAQQKLAGLQPGLRLKIFDGYRPLVVQSYMVEHTFAGIAAAAGLERSAMSDEQVEAAYQQVFQLFARPNPDPQAPPPHSTGGAVDLTIVDENGEPLDMGSEIDAMPPLSLPHHYYGKADSYSRRVQANRELLRTVMVSSGFERLPREWWHFSYGDQGWALIRSIKDRREIPAIYGRIDPPSR